jgi:Fe-Mn family superoxide dismutase
MTKLRNLINLVEAVNKPAEVEILDLSYELSDLAPVMSQDTLNYHYGKLAQGYATRYNAGEGDPDFNYAGAFLHNVFFPQLRAPRADNKPNGPVLNLIKRKFGTWQEFKKQFAAEAMKIQGSGWIYLSYSGDIKTITNHAMRSDILLLVDWWEHAWALDYQSDKKRYLENIWKIINWTVINTRWGKSL